MAARAGMTNLIGQVRTFTNAGTADFSDDYVQSLLDRYRQDWYDAIVAPITQLASSSYEYKIYPFDYLGEFFEENATDSGFALRYSTGGTVSASFTVNYQSRKINFAATTTGESYFLSIRAYNAYAVAADIWEQKAALVADDVDFKTDNHDIKASQEAANYLKQASFYRQKAGGTGGSSLSMGRLIRTDMNP